MHYTTGCGGATPPLGCLNNPHIVNATLVVAADTEDGTVGKLTVSMTGATGLTADPTPAQGYVIVMLDQPSCAFGDVLPPLKVAEDKDDTDNMSTFKQGSRGVVPVKVQLWCDDELIDSQELADEVGDVTLTIKRVAANGGTNGDEATAATSPGNANSGDLFRFDEGDAHFIYNLSIRNLSAGVYELEISGGGATGYAYFEIR
jgi:hypothetical protein